MLELAIGSALFSLGVMWEFRIMRRRIEELERHIALIHSAMFDSVSNRVN